MITKVGSDLEDLNEDYDWDTGLELHPKEQHVTLIAVIDKFLIVGLTNYTSDMDNVNDCDVAM